MKLSSLIKDCVMMSAGKLQAELPYDPDITSIASNSNNINPGSLFIAVKGFTADGHDYIVKAFENGAAAVIAENNPKNIKNVILVENSRLAMASVAATFYGHPSKEMVIVGITGTNGKTTITWLLENIFMAGGFSTGVIGTVNIRYCGKTYDNHVTTPDSIDLQKTLSKMKKSGVSHVIMEVSSHGLDLNRVDFCDFNIGVFTNLSQDHLDYHKDMDEYFNCKKRLFTKLLDSNKKKNATAVLNIDDDRVKTLSKTLSYKTVCISTTIKTDIFAQNITDNIQGLCGTISMPDGSFKFTSSLIGTFNLENILCAAGAAYALDINHKLIKQGIKKCYTIPGRLEKIRPDPDLLPDLPPDLKTDRFLFVDYAHTPGALESILITLKQIAPKRIITIFGCGGDRDKSKRDLMGKIACKHSNIAIVTSDNPRTENPASIIDDILEGLNDFRELSDHDLESTPFKNGYIIEVDRREAIKRAISLSKPKDIIISAGKGHETYQITNSGTIHFDDREELAKAAIKFTEKFKPIEWKTDDLKKALACEPAFLAIEKSSKFAGICIDSRTIKKKDLFLALKGENFDGHTFINPLIKKGIKGFIVQKGFIDTLDTDTKKTIKQNSIIIFETQNTLTALGKLAQYQRLRADVKVLAITGSSGKTTTRKITQEIFNTQFHTLATKGNLNNEIGLPLTLLKLSYSHEWAIVEMGMNHAGEISRLSNIALPDIAMVTNTAGVHLEGLGSVDNVAKAKAEIFQGLNKNSTAIIYGSDPRRKILEAKAKQNKYIKNFLFFGSGKNCDVCGNNISTGIDSTQFAVTINDIEQNFCINSPALFMVDNSLAAICAAMTAGISLKGMQTGIKAFNPVPGRMDIYKLNDSVNIIDDTYNANPASVTAALNTLSNMSMSQNQNSIAVLGDMLELGRDSDKLHWQIGQKAASLGINKLFIFGTQGKHTIKGAMDNKFPSDNIYHGTKEKIIQKVLDNIDSDTWLLVKGSRGMAMESIIQKLKTTVREKFLKTF